MAVCRGAAASSGPLCVTAVSANRPVMMVLIVGD